MLQLRELEFHFGKLICIRLTESCHAEALMFDKKYFPHRYIWKSMLKVKEVLTYFEIKCPKLLHGFVVSYCSGVILCWLWDWSGQLLAIFYLENEVLDVTGDEANNCGSTLPKMHLIFSESNQLHPDFKTHLFIHIGRMHLFNYQSSHIHTPPRPVWR